MTRVIQSCSEITLIFDRAVCQPCVHDFQVLSGRLRRVDGVLSVMTRLDLHGSQRVIVFFQETVTSQQMLRRMAAALRPGANTATDEATQVAPSPAANSSPVKNRIAVQLKPDVMTVARDQHRPLSVRISQFFYGTLAAGSFGMAWVGLLVPGIPTVPFVILTAAFAAKASPAFHRRLMQSRTFGPMIEDWNRYRGIRRSVRNKGIALTAVIVSITLLVAPPSPGLYGLVAFMATFSLVVIWQLPLIKEEDLENPTSPDMTESHTIAAVA